MCIFEKDVEYIKVSKPDINKIIGALNCAMTQIETLLCGGKSIKQVYHSSVLDNIKYAQRTLKEIEKKHNEKTNNPNNS